MRQGTAHMALLACGQARTDGAVVPVYLANLLYDRPLKRPQGFEPANPTALHSSCITILKPRALSAFLKAVAFTRLGGVSSTPPG